MDNVVDVVSALCKALLEVVTFEVEVNNKKQRAAAIGELLRVQCELPPSFENWVVVELARRWRGHLGLNKTLLHNHVPERLRLHQFFKNDLGNQSCSASKLLKTEAIKGNSGSVGYKWPDLSTPDKPFVAVEVKTPMLTDGDTITASDAMWADAAVAHSVNSHPAAGSNIVMLFVIVLPSHLKKKPASGTIGDYLGLEIGDVAAVSRCSIRLPGAHSNLEKVCNPATPSWDLPRELKEQLAKDKIATAKF